MAAMSRAGREGTIREISQKIDRVANEQCRLKGAGILVWKLRTLVAPFQAHHTVDGLNPDLVFPPRDDAGAVKIFPGRAVPAIPLPARILLEREVAHNPGSLQIGAVVLG